MGPVPTDFHEFSDFQKRGRGFLTWYLPCFRPGYFQIRIFEASGRNQKDERRKVTQIRGGITSRSAFFARFVPFQDFHLSAIFESRFPFVVSGLPKKCTLIISVNRMPLMPGS